MTRHRKEEKPRREAEPQPQPRPDESALADEAARPLADATPPAEEAGESQVAKLEAERRELTDRLQRLAADFSNYQKRMQRRLPEERREAVRDLVCDLLPVIDNFEPALAAAEDQHDAKALYDGVRLVHDQLVAALAKHGVEPIEAAGRPFDPEHHEAVAHLPSDDMPTGHVMDEVQRGYRHGDRTLRASRVAVSRGPAEASEAQGAEHPEPEGEPTDGADKA